MTHIILSSARNKCYLQLRSLHQLYQKNKFEDVVAYTAVGSAAPLALMLSLGIAPNVISSTIFSSKIFDSDCAKDLRAYISDLLEPVVCDYHKEIPTLETLYKVCSLTLYLCVWNATAKRIEYISHLTHPHLDCITACSMAYNSPYLHYIQSYCGTVYQDCTHINPLPIHSLDLFAKTICVYVVYIGRDCVAPVKRAIEVILEESITMHIKSLVLPYSLHRCTEFIELTWKGVILPQDDHTTKEKLDMLLGCNDD